METSGAGVRGGFGVGEDRRVATLVGEAHRGYKPERPNFSTTPEVLAMRRRREEGKLACNVGGADGAASLRSFV